MPDEFDPLTGDPMPKVSPASTLKQEQSPLPLSDEELTKLEDMSREGLIALVRRVSGAVWGYALLDDTEKAEAARLKLYNLGMSATEVHKVVPALDKWFDRTSGKAPQSIAMKVEDNSLGKMATDKLLRLAAMLDDPVLIAPMPGKMGDEYAE